MIDSSLDPPKEKTPGNEDEENEEEIDYDKVAIDRKRKRGRKVLITGLNQVSARVIICTLRCSVTLSVCYQGGPL